MKKLMTFLFMLTAFTFTSLNAQTCCKIKKECKPTECCTEKPACCKETKSLESSETVKTESSSVQQSVEMKEPRLKEEEKAVEAKKE